jgi:hypothetical protein
MTMLSEYESSLAAKKTCVAPWDLERKFKFLWTYDKAKRAGSHNLGATNAMLSDENFRNTSTFLQYDFQNPKNNGTSPRTSLKAEYCNICNDGCTVCDEDHVKKEHWYLYSFWPNCVEYIERDNSRSSSGEENIVINGNSNDVGSNFHGNVSGPKTPPRTLNSQSSGGLSISVPEHAADDTGFDSSPRTPVNLLRADSDGVHGGDDYRLKPMTPQQGKKKFTSLRNGRAGSSNSANDAAGGSFSVAAEDLYVSFSMVSHACRLAGYPKALKAPGLSSNAGGKKKNRRRTKSGKARSESFDGGSDDGTFSFDGSSIESNDDNYRIDFLKEQLKQQEIGINSNNALNQALQKKIGGVPTDGDTTPTYEAYSNRRNSNPRLSDNDSSPGATVATVKPENTTPVKSSWADIAGKASAKATFPTSVEITLGDTVIRARTIDQGFHSMVDPTLTEKKKGGFDQTKRLMFVVCINDHNYNVILEHKTVSGGKVLKVNNHEVATKANTMMDFGGKFEFRLANLIFSISIESSFPGYKYKLFLDGLSEPILRC